jgi:hypothetical protein
MSTNHDTSRYFMPVLILVLFSAVILFAFTYPACAAERGYHHQEFMDSRHDHNRSYPARGAHIQALPRDHRAVVYGRSRYYFYGGAWYRPEGHRFIVVAPPYGLIVPFLPPFYTTIWVAGIPYYYANDVYYTQGGGGYMVVEPPKGEPAQTPPAGEQASTGQLYIYPRQGQGEQKQADDRYECHKWAVNQTGYDPIKPPVNMTEAQITPKRTDYQRALSACLDGRGYTVK